MHRAVSLFAGIVAAVVLTATGAQAALQPVCGGHDEIARQLAEEFGEVHHGSGTVGEGRVMEIFISPERGSWTILMTDTGGPTCVVAAGEAWEIIPI